MITEAKIIIGLTKIYIEEKSETQATFASDKLFPALDEAGIQSVRAVNSEKEFYKVLANAKNRIGRIMSGTIEFPWKWKWVWINCLPSPYRERCIHELSALAHSTVPSQNGEHAMADIGLLAKESGEAIMAITVIAADGKYDHNDRPEDIQKALNEAYDLRDTAQAHIDAIERATGHSVQRSVQVTYTKETLTIT